MKSHIRHISQKSMGPRSASGLLLTIAFLCCLFGGTLLAGNAAAYNIELWNSGDGLGEITIVEDQPPFTTFGPFALGPNGSVNVIGITATRLRITPVADATSNLIDIILNPAPPDVSRTLTGGPPDWVLDPGAHFDQIEVTFDSKPQISISDAAPQNEGDAGTHAVSFTVSIDKAHPSQDVKVDYYTTDDSATTSDADYDAKSGSVTFPAGTAVLSALVTVTVNGDNVVEPDEVFLVKLQNQSANALIVNDTAVGTINNDDTALVSIAANDAVAAEPADSGQFTVTLTNLSDTATQVSYSVVGTATPGSDYTALTGSVTIAANSPSATIDVSVVNDDVLEGDETVEVTLTGITGGDGNITLGGSTTAVVTISDEDAALVSISATITPAVEPGTNGMFAVILSNLSSTATQVSYSVVGTATPGSDYTALTGSVTVPAGSVAGAVPILVLDDALLESDETVTVTLNSITGGDADVSIDAANASDTVTISDNETALVSIAANDAAAAEPADGGQFTVTQSALSSTDTVISYTVGGDAVAGTDYTALSGTVTILAGAADATIDVAVLDDALLESDETVTVTLSSITSGDADVSIDAANASDTVTISDNESAQVSIVANDPDAAEPADGGQFTVTQSALSSTDTVISYTVGGDAVAGTDYTALSGTVTILAGAADATIDVAVLDDALLESDETVTVTLSSITSGDADVSIDAANASDTVTISDNESAQVSIVANDPDAAEPADGGQFTVTQSALSSTDTVISYTVGGDAVAGTDYTALSGTVTILAGAADATIDVAVLDDALLESDETVTVTLNSITGGDADVSIDAANASDTVTITDNESAQVSIVANDPDAAEPADGGQFTVTQSALSSTDTVISYTVGGDAVAGTDYTALSGTVTILAGAADATIDVAVLDDALLESDETVTVTLSSITSGDADVSIDAANASDTVTISDNESAQVSIVANDPDAAEPADGGQFTVTQSALSSTDTVISYTVGGDATADADYTALSGTVTILAGAADATIDVAVLDDALLESDETVTVTLNSITGGDADVSIDAANASDTVTITDNESAQVSIVANDPDAAEPADGGQFTVTQSALSSTDTVISYTVGGDAVAGTDYTALSGTVTILAGAADATIDVAVLDDALLESDETVTVTLSSITSGDADVSIDAANASDTVTISDNESAQVSIVANDPDAAEPADGGQFTVTQSALSSTDTVISYTVGGDATADADYTALSGTVTILAGAADATIDVAVLDDALLESDETVTVTLSSITSGDADVSIDAANASDTVTISDNESAQVSIAANDPDAAEPADNGQFTVTLTMTGETATIVNYTVSGSATADADYTALPGSVTIPANTFSATIDVAVLDDILVEGDETVTLTLTGTDNGNISVGSTDAASVTVADNDYVASFATVAASASEGNAMTFTVQLDRAATEAVTVQYTVAEDLVGSNPASSPADFTAATQTATIIVGASSVDITVATADDGIDEPDETFIVTLDSVTSANGVIGSPNEATGTIVDDEYIVTFLVDGNGTLTGSTVQVVSAGGSTSPVTAVPNDTETYFEGWTGDLTADYTVNPLTITGVVGDMSVTAVFKGNPVITPSATGSGDIVPPDPQVVDFLGSVTFDMYPESENCIGDVKVDGVSVGVVNTYTFSSVTSNHTIGVDFRDQYEIRGTIQPFNARTGEGGNGKWKVTGTDTSGGSYDSGWLNHNERLVIPCDVLLDVMVAFSTQVGWETPAPQNVTLSLDTVVTGWYRPVLAVTSADGSVTSLDGGINCNGGGDCTEPYDFNAQVTVEAAPNTSFVFKNWAGDIAGAAPTITFIMNEPREIIAVYDAATATNTDWDQRRVDRR